MEWTDEKIETMRRLLAEGFSCGYVAAQLGTTRNSVIGKVRRIEIETGEKWKRPSGRTYGARQKAPPAATPGLATVLQLKRPLPASARPKPVKYVPGVPVGIIDATGCRWPVDQGNVPGRHLFCNGAIHKGSYCEFHAKRNASLRNAPSRNLYRLHSASSGQAATTPARKAQSQPEAAP
jgi:GcrA cell cycle regulator